MVFLLYCIRFLQSDAQSQPSRTMASGDDAVSIKELRKQRKALRKIKSAEGLSSEQVQRSAARARRAGVGRARGYVVGKQAPAPTHDVALGRALGPVAHVPSRPPRRTATLFRSARS